MMMSHEHTQKRKRRDGRPPMALAAALRLSVGIAAVGAAMLTPACVCEKEPSTEPYIKVRPCKPPRHASRAALKAIRRAAADIWGDQSPHLADRRLSAWAHRRFQTQADFSAFLINWANVETGGHFDPLHENWSKGETERNVGVFQINQTWAVRNDTYGDGQSNPKNYGPSEAQDPYLATYWALYHLTALERPAKGKIRPMLDAYWHGTFHDDSPYARGVLRGEIIDHPE